MGDVYQATDTKLDRRVFSTRIVRQPFKAQYTFSRDGRFLVHNLSAEQAPASPLILIVNWRP